MEEPKKKTVIVTGASGNLGHAVVTKFLEEGHTVIGTQSPHDAGSIVHPRLEKITVDLMNEENAGQLVQYVIEKYKTIDAVVATVGGFAMGSIAETKTADIYKQYKLNFETAYNVARPACVQMMKQAHGRIFLIGSRPGLEAKSGKGMVAYGLGKSLLFRLAELLNDEARGTNVVTSVVVPSTIDTPQNRNAMPEANFEDWVKPEAIANTIYFYTTPDAVAIREPIIKAYNKA